jgi:hypothetical protein
MSEVIQRSEIRVLHCGDVWLGSAFLSPAPERSAERRRAQNDAVNRLLRYVKEQDVSLVLITGNLFAEKDLSDETVTYLIRSFAAIRSTKFIIFPGRDDPYTADCFYASGRLPDNVEIFRSGDWEALRYPELGIAVYGSAVTDPDAPSAPFPVCQSEEGEIVLLGGYRKTPPSPEEYAGAGADFIALSGCPDTALQESSGTLLAYSGSPESCGYENESVGGANLLMIVEEAGVRRIHYRRLDFGTCRCLSREIDVSEMRTESDLITAITRLIRENNLGRNAILRVILKGSTLPGFRIPQRFDSGSFGMMVFSVLNLTTPAIDPLLAKDMSAKGELYRLLEPKIASGTDAERAAAARALTIGLAALEGKDISQL